MLDEEDEEGRPNTTSGPGRRGGGLSPKKRPASSVPAPERPSSITTVFPQNPAKHGTPFPVAVKGHLLVNYNAKGGGGEGSKYFRYNPRQAAVLLQGFARFIVAKGRVRGLKEYVGRERRETETKHC